MKISTKELSLLMDRVSDTPSKVNCVYGSGEVYLKDTPENEWAREIILKLRKAPQLKKG